MTGIAEGIAAGLGGMLVLILLTAVLMGVVCAVILILCKIPSIPLHTSMDGLHFRDSVIWGDGDIVEVIGGITIAIAVFLLVMYLFGFVLIEYGGMTIESS